MKMFFFLVPFICLSFFALQAFSFSSEKKRVSIIAPIEHQAIRDITKGFADCIKQEGGQEIVLEVYNTQGDARMQQALIELCKRREDDLVAPIGTDLCIMAQKMLKHTAIVALDVTEMVEKKKTQHTGILESPIEPSYLFLKQLLPGLKKLSMVYSSSDKNVAMLEQLKEFAKKDAVEVQELMIYQLSDLYSCSKSVASDSQAIFIAKDHLAASGASNLAKVARERKIPFIASDEGSVIAGAAIAMGNKESEIGKAGARLALELLKGNPGPEIMPLKSYTLFINLQELKHQGLDLEQVKETSTALNYPLEIIHGA